MGTFITNNNSINFNIKKQISEFCKNQDTCNNSSSKNLINRISQVKLITNEKIPNGLNILDGSSQVSFCIVNNFFLYNPVFGRINNLAKNNQKLRINAGTAFSRPEFGYQVNNNSNRKAGATWQNNFPSLSNCSKVDRIIEKNFNLKSNNGFLEDTNRINRCKPDKTEKKIVTIFISYNYNCLYSGIVNEEPETIYGFLLFGIFNNCIKFYSEKAKTNNIFLSTIDFKKNICCGNNLIKIFYNQTDNLGKLHKHTNTGEPLYHLYETNMDIPINNLSSIDKIYIGDNAIKLTNSINCGSPYITLNDLVEKLSNIQKIYSYDSIFKLSFLEQWIYELFTPGHCLNRSTFLQINNTDIKNIQCYNIFFTKTIGITLEQILGLKSWNKIKLFSKNNWPNFYNFFKKNNNLPQYIPKPGTKNFSYKGNHKILALLYLLYQGEGLTNINKDVKIFAFEGKCFNLNKNFNQHTQQFFCLDPNKNGALQVSAVSNNFTFDASYDNIKIYLSINYNSYWYKNPNSNPINFNNLENFNSSNCVFYSNYNTPRFASIPSALIYNCSTNFTSNLTPNINISYPNNILSKLGSNLQPFIENIKIFDIVNNNFNSQYLDTNGMQPLIQDSNILSNINNFYADSINIINNNMYDENINTFDQITFSNNLLQQYT